MADKRLNTGQEVPASEPPAPEVKPPEQTTVEMDGGSRRRGSVR